MHLRWALLALLGEEESHGYGLVKRFNRRLGPLWHPNVGQVYQVLHQLERRGLVSSRTDPCGSRMRRRFRLTGRGEKALHAWLSRRPGWPEPPRQEIFVRLLAAERHGPDAVRTQLERQETEWQRWLEQVRDAMRSSGDGSVSSALARDAVLGQAEAHLQWLARCRERLGATARPASSLASG